MSVVGRALGGLWDAFLDVLWLAGILAVVYVALLLAAPEAPGLLPVLHTMNRMGLGVWRFVEAVTAHLRK